jgi:bifunctional DNA-binding transcriptional regulator/antitoxin component of YhaV-PrlF toxin-antitoxin module
MCKKLQIEPGDTFEIETQGDEIKLRPVRSQATMRKKRGVRVFRTGEPLMAETVNKIIEEVRDERDASNRNGDS